MSFDAVNANNEARERYIQGLMNSYTEREKKLEGRKIEYFRKNRDAKIDAALITGTGAVVGAIGGAAIGAIVGGTCGTPGGPPGMALGAGVGAIVGGVAGGVIGAGITVVYLRPRYQEWCKTEAGKEFGGKISYFINESNILEHLTCPISSLPVIDGVRTPNGQLYERSLLMKWIKDNGTDPMTRAPLKVEDLIDDEKASLESAKALINFLVSKREETAKLVPKLIDGYDQLIQDTRESLMFVHNTKLSVLQKQWQKGKITYKELEVKSKELHDQYMTT